MGPGSAGEGAGRGRGDRGEDGVQQVNGGAAGPVVELTEFCLLLAGTFITQRRSCKNPRLSRCNNDLRDVLAAAPSRCARRCAPRCARCCGTLGTASVFALARHTGTYSCCHAHIQVLSVTALAGPWPILMGQGRACSHEHIHTQLVAAENTPWNQTSRAVRSFWNSVPLRYSSAACSCR